MTDLLEEIQSRLEICAKATAGPWEFIDAQQDGPSDKIVWSKGDHTGRDEEDDAHNTVCILPNDSYGYSCNYHDNGPFIAASRNQREGELAALKVAVYELEKTKRMEGDKSAGVRAAIALAQITKLMEL